MNLRFEILRAVSKNPGAPMAEIIEAIDHDRQKTTWSVRDCAKEGLLSMRRDDVTGQPGYTLTTTGKQRLAEGPGRKQRAPSAKEPQPAVGNKPGSSALALPSSAEGAAVQPNPAPDAAASTSAAPVAADDQAATDKESLSAPPPEYDPRSVSFNPAARADAATDMSYGLLGLLADIRAAIGDREGKLMQDELVERIRAVAKAAAVANADLDKIRDTLPPTVYTGDPEHAPGPVESAQHAARWIKALSDTNLDYLTSITCASETLAAVVHSDTDTSDMDLDELAKHVAAQLSKKDAELLEQAREIVALRDTITQRNAELRNANALAEKLDHLLESARNEAEHLRKHAAQPGEQAESIEVGFLLEAVRDLLPDQTRITVPGGQSYVSIRAFGHNFDVSPYEAENILGHISALAKYAELPF